MIPANRLLHSNALLNRARFRLWFIDRTACKRRRSSVTVETRQNQAFRTPVSERYGDVSTAVRRISLGASYFASSIFTPVGFANRSALKGTSFHRRY
jgi:hypothetical protein